MPTPLDYDGHLPAYANIADSKTTDSKVAYDIPLLKSSVIVADRFYNDFSLLNVWDSNQVYFVVRYKNNIKFKPVNELELPEQHHQHVLKDKIIELKDTKTKEKYPRRLRTVALLDYYNLSLNHLSLGKLPTISIFEDLLIYQYRFILLFNVSST